jgi:hypothetical protein
MRDGVIAVSELGARPSVSLLRALKREFGFYCIELHTEQAAEPERPEIAYAIGGLSRGATLSRMEQYDASSGQWSAAAPMGTARYSFGACVLDGELYVTGGKSDDGSSLLSVEKYSPSTDTWSAVAPLPAPRFFNAAVTVGSDMYVLGGIADTLTASVLKFDSMLGAWIQVAPMPAARFAMASCAFASDIYVFVATIPALRSSNLTLLPTSGAH